MNGITRKPVPLHALRSSQSPQVVSLQPTIEPLATVGYPKPSLSVGSGDAQWSLRSLGTMM